MEARRAGSTRLLSRKTVELMTHDQLGKIDPEQGFGLGFGIEGVKEPMSELGSVGEYNWGGFFYTGFTIDPERTDDRCFHGATAPDWRFGTGP